MPLIKFKSLKWCRFFILRGLLFICFFHFLGCTKTFVDNGLNQSSMLPENEAYPSNKVYSLAIFKNQIFVANDLGLSVTSNYGDGWRNISIGCQQASEECSGLSGAFGVVLDSSKTIFLTTKKGLQSSNDLGAKWTLSQPNLGANLILNKLSISENILFATVNSGILGSGFAFSNNKGSLWEGRSVIDQVGNNYARSTISSAGSWYVLTGNTDGVCLKKSMDQGQSWTNITPPDFTNEANCPPEVIIVGGKIFLSSIKGIYISADDGATWINRTSANGLPYDSYDYFAYDKEKNRLWVGSFGQPLLIYSDDLGQVWQTKNIGINGFYLQNGLAANAGLLVLGSYGNGVAISSDNGEHFDQFTK